VLALSVPWWRESAFAQTRPPKLWQMKITGRSDYRYVLDA
jgi:hypothetical protein